MDWELEAKQVPVVPHTLMGPVLCTVRKVPFPCLAFLPESKRYQVAKGTSQRIKLQS